MSTDSHSVSGARDARSTKKLLTDRLFLTWGVAILLLIALAVILVVSVLPWMRESSARRAVETVVDARARNMITAEEAVERLGGRDVAARQLSDYTAMPNPWRYVATEMLGLCGSSSVPSLTKLLTDADVHVRQAAAEALTLVADKRAVKQLALALVDPDGIVRANAARALSRVGVDAAPCIPALTIALQDGDSRVRANAAHALGCIGPAAKTAVRLLSNATRDVDWAVSGNAMWALGQVAPLDEATAHALVQAMNNPDWRVRTASLRIAGRIASPCTELLEKIEAMKTDPDPRVQDAARKVSGKCRDAPAREPVDGSEAEKQEKHDATDGETRSE